MNATTTHEPKNPVPTTAPLVPCTIDANGIATVRLGRADESVVTFTRERLLALGEVLSSLRQNRALRGVIIAGSAPGMFCAGADINLIHSIASVEEGTAAANTGREVFQLCRQLPVPVVAAIEGPCVGGGCELALFCDLRVASDHPATQIGLPETKLGIVPGFGGTQNMARLIGLPNALDMILAGKLLKPVPAKKKGLLDRVVPSDKLLSTALAELQKLIQQGKKAPKRKLRGAAFWFSKTPLRAIAARAARKALSDGPAKFYPAPRLALELCLQAFTQPVAQG
ncbi:MAG: enoyl-CoA hydratase-related protein, partial [Planctomycetota bacterium]